VEEGGRCNRASRAPTHPAVQLPLHWADDRPGVAPKVPLGHGAHTSKPPALNRPAGHTEAVALTDPAGHACPAAHGPAQADVTDPVPLPYRPGAHKPLHTAAVRPSAAPKRPAAQGLQAPAPLALNCPATHSTCVEEVAPVGHAYPAVQSPSQAATVSPAVAPNFPAGHWAQPPAPPAAYCPGVHCHAVADVEPAGQKKPACGRGNRSWGGAKKGRQET
jgi:hypothetical protein